MWMGVIIARQASDSTDVTVEDSEGMVYLVLRILHCFHQGVRGGMVRVRIWFINRNFVAFSQSIVSLPERRS